MAGPITGLRIIDMTTVLMGPYATQILGDLGADVIKVEDPAGDQTRTLGPFRHERMGATALNLHRNKRSIVLDLKQPDGRDALLKLASTADAVIHNMRPQAIARLGLAYADVARVNPRVVYCSAQGYRRDGPYGHKPAYDDLIQGASGIAALMARMNGEPQYVPVAICDKIAGLTIAYAVLAALLHRERAGEGQELEVPMFESLLSFNLVEHIAGRAFEPPLGTVGYPRLLSRFRKPFRTADGYVCMMPYSNKHWSEFFRMVHRPDLAADARFATLASRTEHTEALYGVLEEIVAKRPTGEWLRVCDDASIPAMPVMELDEMWEDPHLKQTGFFELAEHPSEGAYWRIGSPVGFFGTPVALTRHAPRLGQHGAEILGELGYASEDIAAMIARGVTVAGDGARDTTA